MKYIVISGGVISGIGKGVIASSTGLLLKTLGFRVTAVKIDPYVNIDAGLMAPTEHGECFVLDDGGEVDLDLGNYERYLDITLGKDNNITTGKIFREVIEKERQGTHYLGRTVQIIPHVTDAIQDWIERAARIPVDKDAEGEDEDDGLFGAGGSGSKSTDGGGAGASKEGDGADDQGIAGGEEGEERKEERREKGQADICIVELGGTIGDIESMMFVEALRQFQFRVGVDNFALVHVSLVPDIHGELKTKPTQNSVKDLRGLGLSPDLVCYGIETSSTAVTPPPPTSKNYGNYNCPRCAPPPGIACRCFHPVPPTVRRKISQYCHVGPSQVLAVHDLSSIYHVPLLLREQGLVDFLRSRLKLDEYEGKLMKLGRELGGGVESDWEGRGRRRWEERKNRGEQLAKRWRDMTVDHDRLVEKVTIVLVGKYVSFSDSYTSVIKSLEHASFRCHKKLILELVDSSHLEKSAQEEFPREYHAAWHKVCSADGIIVPGGFGPRGTEGMMAASKWAREKKVPFLGICLGFQVAVIEWTRNVMGLKDANSTELDPETPTPVIVFMPEISRTHLGGTQRLGLRPTIFQPATESWSLVRMLYGGPDTIWERHRHRYEVSPKMVEDIEKSGLSFTGRDERGERMQVMEWKEHPFFVGLQAHPEFCTRPLNPSPPYLGFVAASSGCLDEQILLQKDYIPPQPARHHRVPSPPELAEDGPADTTTSTPAPISGGGITNRRN